MRRTIGSRLAQARRAAGFSQRQVARWLEVPVRHLRAMEQDRRPVSVPLLTRCAALFGVSFAHLMDLDTPLPVIARLPRATSLSPDATTAIAFTHAVHLGEFRVLLQTDLPPQYSVPPPGA